MNDENKSKRQLIGELAELRQRVAELEAMESALQGAEDAQRDGENNYRTLLDHLPQKIFWKDRNSVYVSCNENLARDLGITPEELPGKTDHDFFPRELAEKYRSDDRRIMESGETETIEERYIQDGEEVVVQTVKTPVKNGEGETIGIWGIFWDITERKQAEEAMLGKDDFDFFPKKLAEKYRRDDRRVVDGFTNAREALDVLRRDHYRQAFVDLQMPDMTGHDFMEELNRLPDKKRPLKVILTGRLDHPHEDYARLDVFATLHKASSHREVLQIVEKGVATGEQPGEGARN